MLIEALASPCGHTRTELALIDRTGWPRCLHTRVGDKRHYRRMLVRKHAEMRNSDGFVESKHEEQQLRATTIKQRSLTYYHAVIDMLEDIRPLVRRPGRHRGLQIIPLHVLLVVAHVLVVPSAHRSTARSCPRRLMISGAR